MTGFTGLVEFLPSFAPRPEISHVLFDFDGTLSLIRQGWPEVMVPMFVECLPPIAGETPEQRQQLCYDDIMRLNGKQTIYQMIQLAEEIARRGGAPEEPLRYKYMYLDRLWERIKGRVADLKAGRVAADDLMVPGSHAMLTALRARGVRCYLASGTDEPFVIDEAAALGLTPFFAGIYGARDDYKTFSKKMIIERIIAENGLAGPEFVAFGDGFVEIEDARRVGGIAVGLATNEATRTGIDAWKRTRLIEAGADIIVGDFRAHDALLRYLFAE